MASLGYWFYVSAFLDIAVAIAVLSGITSGMFYSMFAALTCIVWWLRICLGGYRSLGWLRQPKTVKLLRRPPGGEDVKFTLKGSFWTPPSGRGPILSVDDFVGSMAGFRPSHGRFLASSVKVSNASGVLRKGRNDTFGVVRPPTLQKPKSPQII